MPMSYGTGRDGEQQLDPIAVHLEMQVSITLSSQATQVTSQ